MKSSLILKEISDKYNEKIISYNDVDNNVVVYIRNIDKIKKKKYLYPLEGRGVDYEKACDDFINKAMDSSFNLRYKLTLYSTTNIRAIIRKYSKKL